MSKEVQQQLNAINGILGNIYSYDYLLRVITYGSLLTVEGLKTVGQGDGTLAKFLLEVFEKLTDARFVNRLGGFSASVAWYLAALKNGSSTSALLNRGMAASMVLYYPMEHIWYFSTFKNKYVNVNSNWWCLWYCRVWLAYVIMDYSGTMIRIRKLKQKIAGDTEDSKPALKRELKNEWIWTRVVFCDFVMALQWSLEAGPFSDNFISFVGLYGGVVALYLKWRRATVKDKEE
mmetsp:Transcript_7652/g.8790  ORF Transcript_7652/g.8790 Transcript_7652/m.8790 type:complete len:233 (-) Transcript_7652:801-1499(-)